MEQYYKLQNNIVFVYLKGELDEHSATNVRDFIDKLINDLSFKQMILNMEYLTFMDSTGIGIIIGRYKKLKAKGIPLYVEGQSNQVDKVIKASGLYNILNVR